jgi:hypothetical protein
MRPASISSDSASDRFAGMIPSCTASDARTRPASTSPMVGSASGGTSK